MAWFRVETLNLRLEPTTNDIDVICGVCGGGMVHSMDLLTWALIDVRSELFGFML